MTENDQDEQTLVNTQRLKAAVHYTVGKICEEIGESKDIEYSKQFIAVLSEATFKYSQSMVQDAELFAKHAKRTVIAVDDIKLLARKSPALLQHLKDSFSDLDIQVNDDSTTGAKRGRKKRKANDTATETNMEEP